MSSRLTERRPPKYRGLTRAATIGRIVGEDARAGDVPLVRTLYDVRQANAVSFDPPYSDAKLRALALAQLKKEGVAVDA